MEMSFQDESKQGMAFTFVALFCLFFYLNFQCISAYFAQLLDEPISKGTYFEYYFLSVASQYGFLIYLRIIDVILVFISFLK